MGDSGGTGVSPEAGSKVHGQDAHDTTAVHEIAGIFPPMREQEFEALVADIQEHGQFEPIWTYQGKDIDGRHRLRACKQLGMTPRTQEWDGDGSLLEFVIALNLHRRQLKETQRAMIAARMMPKFAAEARDRQRTHKAVDPDANCAQGQNQLPANWPEGDSRDLVGKLLNVGGKSVDRARKVLENGCLALIDAVDHGRLAVSTAAALAELEMDKQACLLALGRKAIAEALHGVPPASRRPEASGTEAPTPPPVAPAPPLLAGEGAGGRGDPDQQKADDFLLRYFSMGGFKLVKDGQGFRLELGHNFQHELSRTVRDSRFAEIVNRGLSVVIGKSA